MKWRAVLLLSLGLLAVAAAKRSHVKGPRALMAYGWSGIVEEPQCGEPCDTPCDTPCTTPCQQPQPCDTPCAQPQPCDTPCQQPQPCYQQQSSGCNTVVIQVDKTIPKVNMGHCATQVQQPCSPECTENWPTQYITECDQPQVPPCQPACQPKQYADEFQNIYGGGKLCPDDIDELRGCIQEDMHTQDCEEEQPCSVPQPACPPSPCPEPSPCAAPKPKKHHKKHPKPCKSPQPSPKPCPPSPCPSPVPSPVPSPHPSPVPSPQPSPVPSPVPSPHPSPLPSPPARVPSPPYKPLATASPAPASPKPSPQPSPAMKHDTLAPSPQPSPVPPSPQPSPLPPSPQPSPVPMHPMSVDSVEDAVTYLNQGYAYLDVRTPEEFAAGHVQGAINIPWTGDESFLAAVQAQWPDANTQFVIACYSGHRAGPAATMIQPYYHNCILFTGGWAAWSAAGMPVDYSR